MLINYLFLLCLIPGLMAEGDILIIDGSLLEGVSGIVLSGTALHVFNDVVDRNSQCLK